MQIDYDSIELFFILFWMIIGPIIVFYHIMYKSEFLSYIPKENKKKIFLRGIIGCLILETLFLLFMIKMGLLDVFK